MTKDRSRVAINFDKSTIGINSGGRGANITIVDADSSLIEGVNFAAKIISVEAYKRYNFRPHSVQSNDEGDQIKLDNQRGVLTYFINSER